MPLITRLSRLMQADLHAVLDRLEEPDALLRQAIREMEDDLNDDRDRARRGRAELTRLDAADAESAPVLARLDGELDICFRAGNEDLAKTLVRRKLELSRATALRGQRSGAVRRELEVLEARIADNAARLEAMRANADALSEPGADGACELGVGGASVHPSVSRADVDVAFLAEKHKRGTP